MRIVLGVVVTAVLALVAPAPAEACSCEVPGPPCAELFRSTVFIGKVTKVVSGRGSSTTTFDVVETLNAAFPLGKTVTITHNTDGNTCGTSFARGKTYVVYAGGTSASSLAIGRCTSTHLLGKNDEDVALARTKPSRTEALVEGWVGVLTGDSSESRAGIEIRAAGTTKSGKSDASGKFSFSVPPGSYQLEVVTPDLWIRGGEPVSISLPVAAACALPRLVVAYDGRIEGTVTEAGGKPAANVEVYAMAKREDDRHGRLSGKTDAAGRYVIHEVPAGTFYVGISIPDFGGTLPASPYPTTYYPGTPDLAKAKPLVTKQAGRVAKIDFVVPAAAKLVTYRGVVRHADGKPAVGATISLLPAGRNRSTGMAADAKGAFTVTELAGEDVVLRACFGSKCVEDKRKTTVDAVIDLTLP